MKRLLVVFVSFLLCLAASAQGTREVTGTVKDENGEALAGASVIVKGGSNKNYALTDIDGKYKLSARLDASSVLVSLNWECLMLRWLWETRSNWT